MKLFSSVFLSFIALALFAPNSMLKANDPLERSDGSDPSPNGGVEFVNSYEEGVQLLAGMDGGGGYILPDFEDVRRIRPPYEPTPGPLPARILLDGTTGKANDPVEGADGSDPSPNGEVELVAPDTDLSVDEGFSPIHEEPSTDFWRLKSGSIISN